jgi:hypothetical protein
VLCNIFSEISLRGAFEKNGTLTLINCAARADDAHQIVVLLVGPSGLSTSISSYASLVVNDSRTLPGVFIFYVVSGSQ